MFLFSPGTFRSDAEAIEAFAAGFAENPPAEAAFVRQLVFCRDHDARARLSDEERVRAGFQAVAGDVLRTSNAEFLRLAKETLAVKETGATTCPL